jgi:hypothetical protein
LKATMSSDALCITLRMWRSASIGASASHMPGTSVSTSRMSSSSIASLHQGQLRPVGAFADELGIQAHAGGATGETRGEVGGVGNPVVHGAVERGTGRQTTGCRTRRPSATMPRRLPLDLHDVPEVVDIAPACRPLAAACAVARAFRV